MRSTTVHWKFADQLLPCEGGGDHVLGIEKDVGIWKELDTMGRVETRDRDEGKQEKEEEIRNSGWMRKVEAAKKLIQAGFTTELPYLLHLLQSLVIFRMQVLLKKFSLPLPKSRRVLMVPDPTGTLAPNEIFVQLPDIDRETGTRPGVLDCEVLVMRNPAYLASDIQRVRAVHCPALLRYTDVVIMSVNGDKSLASLLGGGDYDGDDCLIIWDQALVKSFSNQVAQVPSVAEYFEEDKRSVGEVLSVTLADNSGETCVCDADCEMPVISLPLLPRTISAELFRRFVKREAYELVGRYTRLYEQAAERLGVNHEEVIFLATMCAELLDAAKTGKRLLPDKDRQIVQRVNRLIRCPSDQVFGRQDSGYGSDASFETLVDSFSDETMEIDMDDIMSEVEFALHTDEIPSTDGTPSQKRKVCTWILASLDSYLKSKVQRLTEEHKNAVSSLRQSLSQRKMIDEDLVKPWEEYRNTLVTSAADVLLFRMNEILVDYNRAVSDVWKECAAKRIAREGAPTIGQQTCEKDVARARMLTEGLINTYSSKIFQLGRSSAEDFHTADRTIASLAYYVGFSGDNGFVRWNHFPFCFPAVFDVLVHIKTREQALRLGKDPWAVVPVAETMAPFVFGKGAR
ncbi:RNA dependent RNA polymerase-domain-containing protein [Gaertneriomyces semiglobifer]|nr:RNA dependent RNA polymerase-domain-containing protein [Gaertneriomyces semiglobifer]